ncbi:MAG: hypothetical protein R6V85_21280 [Polyangia bacterium]
MRFALPVFFVLLAACALESGRLTPQDEEPDYQDLDGGGSWPADTEVETGVLVGMDSDSSSDTEPAGDTDSSSSDEDGPCLDLGWDDYQVSGTCPGLPAVGSIVQEGGCQISILGQLGEVIGSSGEVAGSLVETIHCSGLAEPGDPPAVDLTCAVDDASCSVHLSGGGDK